MCLHPDGRRYAAYLRARSDYLRRMRLCEERLLRRQMPVAAGKVLELALLAERAALLAEVARLEALERARSSENGGE